MDNFEKTLKKIKKLKTVERPARNPLILLRNLPADLLGPQSKKMLDSYKKRVNKKIRGLIDRHYGFNEENS